MQKKTKAAKTSVGICVSWSDQTTWPMRSNGEADVAAGNADDGDHQRNCRREGQGPRKIAVGHGHDAGGNHERHCRCRSDRQLAARSKYRVGNSRHEIAIEAGDRRKLRQRRVGEGLRNDEGRKRQPGDQVEAHALPRVRADPVGRRKPSKTCIVCLFTHAASPINPRLLAASDIFNLLIYINICRLARMFAIGPRCWAKVHFPT